MVGLTNAVQGPSRPEAQTNTATQKAAKPPRQETKPNDVVDLSPAAVAKSQARNNFEANTKASKTVEQPQHKVDTHG